MQRCVNLRDQPVSDIIVVDDGASLPKKMKIFLFSSKALAGVEPLCTNMMDFKTDVVRVP